jgi:flagellar basal-body rod protein FlgB
MSMITDSTMTALGSSLQGLAQRQQVTANNIANIDTPGFLAGRTDFESSLANELANGESPVTGSSSVMRSSDPTRTDGNNVNLDTEMTIQTETGLRYQLALKALDGKYDVIRSALRTS